LAEGTNHSPIFNLFCDLRSGFDLHSIRNISDINEELEEALSQGVSI